MNYDLINLNIDGMFSFKKDCPFWDSENEQRVSVDSYFKDLTAGKLESILSFSISYV